MGSKERKATQLRAPAGVETVKDITEEAVRLGIKYLTLYTFSTENWNRPSEEVAALMGLILSSLEEELFKKNNVRFRVIGDTSRLPENVQKDRSLHCTYGQQRQNDYGCCAKLLVKVGDNTRRTTNIRTGKKRQLAA